MVIRTCDNCNKEFNQRPIGKKREASQKLFFCSKGCRLSYHKITLICERCNKSFEVPNQYKTRKYCSQKCYHATPKKPTGIRPTFKKCEVCQKNFRVYPCETDRARFCSKRCSDYSRITPTNLQFIGAIKCRNCFKIIEGKPSEIKHRLYCSLKCKSEHQSVNLNCRKCNAEMKRPKSAQHTYCSAACRYTAVSQEKRKLKTKPCFTCKKEFYVRQARPNQKRFFCSKKCFDFIHCAEEKKEAAKLRVRDWNLIRYRPSKWTPVSLEALIKRDGENCYLCGELLKVEDMTLEHLIPISRNGLHKMENIKIACKSCNSSKRDKCVTEFKKWRGDYDRFKG